MTMQTQAQCENTVTISEPMVCTREVSEGRWESKGPLPQLAVLSRTQIGVRPEFLALAIILLVFSDLRAKTPWKWRRIRNPIQYLQNSAFVLLRGEWFGPNFVTILAEGVRVCSS